MLLLLLLLLLLTFGIIVDLRCVRLWPCFCADVVLLCTLACDCCCFVRARYDVVGRYERLVSDGRKLLQASGLWEPTRHAAHHAAHHATASEGSAGKGSAGKKSSGKGGGKATGGKRDGAPDGDGDDSQHGWDARAKAEAVRGAFVASQVCAHFTPALLART